MKFANSIAGRLLIAALCVAATQVVVRQVKQGIGLNAAEAAKFNTAALPLQLDQWSGKDTEVDPRLFQQLGAVNMVNRVYENDTGGRGVVHLASFSTAELSLPHPPELCCKNAGWTVLKNVWKTANDGRRYRLLIIERDGAQAVVAYWYQFGRDVASNRDELRTAMQKFQLARKPWPQLVKVLMQVPIEASDADSQAVAEELGTEIFKWVASKS